MTQAPDSAFLWETQHELSAVEGRPSPDFDSATALAKLIILNDYLMKSADRLEGLHRATRVIRQATGAQMTPIYLIDESGTTLKLTPDESVGSQVIETCAEMPVDEHVHSPWVNPEHWPVSVVGKEKQWEKFPAEFRAWFGTSGVIVPLHSDDHHLGAVLLTFAEHRVLTADEFQFLAAAGRIMGNVIYRWQLLARERELGVLEERRRLSDELHVDLSQQIAALGLQAELIKEDLDDAENSHAKADVARLIELTELTKRSLRVQMLGLHSDMELLSDDLDLQLQQMAKEFERAAGISTALTVEANRASAVALPIASQLLRVVKEALNNVLVHAHAHAVSVNVKLTPTRASVEVVDDGKGFTPAEVPSTKLGLRIMRERMEQVGGTLVISSDPGKGTLVRADVVLHDPALRGRGREL